MSRIASLSVSQFLWGLRKSNIVIQSPYVVPATETRREQNGVCFSQIRISKQDGNSLHSLKISHSAKSLG